VAAFEAAKARAKKEGKKAPTMGYTGHISSEGRLLRDEAARVGEMLKGWDDGLELEDAGRQQYLEELCTFLLETDVLKELATVALHADFCRYWRYVCWQPGSLSQVGNRYISELQGYVLATGDKGALPALVFGVAFLLEDLQQFRPAAIVYTECVRTIEHLQLLHPLLLNSLKPNLGQQLIHMLPKAKLHLAFCLRKAGILRQSQLIMQDCLATVASNKLYEWARADVYLQTGLLARERAQYQAAEKALDRALRSCAPHDITGQARVLDELMRLFREAAEICISSHDLKGAKKLLDKELKAAITARRLWTDYLYLEVDEGSRPPSALVSMFRKSKRPQSAAISSCHVRLAYEPRIPNQATNVTVMWTWGRNIDVGDVFELPLNQLRAGGDKEEMALDGPFAFDFTAAWEDLNRILRMKAVRAHKAFTEVTLTVTTENGLRLPVKQGGVAVALREEGVMEITKVRVIKDKLAFHDVRPQTGRSSQASSRINSRPATRETRPLTRGSEGSRPATSLTIAEDTDDLGGGEEAEKEARGSLDAARLLSRAGDVLSFMARLQLMRHRKMLKERDAWLDARHAFQRKDAKWELRTQNDNRLEEELMGQLEQLQVKPMSTLNLEHTQTHTRTR